MRVAPLILAEVVTPDWHPVPNRRFPVYGYLVVHPDGPFLVDTSVGSGNPFTEKQYRPKRRSLAEALSAVGVVVGDVRPGINTQLHFDHCGQSALFPSVPITVQPVEWQQARGERYTVREWVDSRARGTRPSRVNRTPRPASGSSSRATTRRVTRPSLSKATMAGNSSRGRQRKPEKSSCARGDAKRCGRREPSASI